MVPASATISLFLNNNPRIQYSLTYRQFLPFLHKFNVLCLECIKISWCGHFEFCSFVKIL